MSVKSVMFRGVIWSGGEIARRHRSGGGAPRGSRAGRTIRPGSPTTRRSPAHAGLPPYAPAVVDDERSVSGVVRTRGLPRARPRRDAFRRRPRRLGGVREAGPRRRVRGRRGPLRRRAARGRTPGGRPPRGGGRGGHAGRGCGSRAVAPSRPAADVEILSRWRERGRAGVPVEARPRSPGRRAAGSRCARGRARRPAAPERARGGRAGGRYADAADRIEWLAEHPEFAAMAGVSRARRRPLVRGGALPAARRAVGPGTSDTRGKTSCGRSTRRPTSGAGSSGPSGGSTWTTA